jgi:hypothetical protein
VQSSDCSYNLYQSTNTFVGKPNYRNNRSEESNLTCPRCQLVATTGTSRLCQLAKKKRRRGRIISTCMYLYVCLHVRGIFTLLSPSWRPHQPSTWPYAPRFPVQSSGVSKSVCVRLEHTRMRQGKQQRMHIHVGR